VAEWATQEYQLRPDARTLDKTGNGWWGRSGTGGGGERDRYALGAEFSVPVTDTLTLPLAVRWDKYDDDSDVDDAVTYNAGFEWRPMRELLIRGTYATSFRAPDMHFLFAGDSGFFTTVRDYYLCRRDEPDTAPTFTECQTNSGFSIAGNRAGNINLEEEEGDSFTVGFVWEIFDGFSLNVDYYDIELEGIVNDMSIDGLLRDEADCRLGVTLGGQPVDPNSVECQRVLARITRVDIPNAPNHENLIDVTIGPINRSFSGQTGLDAGFNYTFDTERAGLFSFNGAYTHVLESERQEFPEDPVDDSWRDNKQNFEFRSRFRGSAGWTYKDFNTVITALRQWTFNLNMAYDFTDAFRLSLISTNVTNERPPVDETFTGWPGFFRGSFNPVGREVWIQADYVFGR
jgi:outer membrane receptor protein involved in Fe transport